MHFIHTRPFEMALIHRRFLDGQKKFHLNAVGQSVKGHVTRSAGMMQAEAMAAGGKNGGLQFENQLVGQAGVISKKACHTAHRRGQTLIGVQAQSNVEGVAGHV